MCLISTCCCLNLTFFKKELSLIHLLSLTRKSLYFPCFVLSCYLVEKNFNIQKLYSEKITFSSPVPCRYLSCLASPPRHLAWKHNETQHPEYSWYCKQLRNMNILRTHRTTWHSLKHSVDIILVKIDDNINILNLLLKNKKMKTTLFRMLTLEFPFLLGWDTEKKIDLVSNSLKLPEYAIHPPPTPPPKQTLDRTQIKLSH